MMRAFRIVLLIVVMAFIIAFVFGCASAAPDCTMSGMSAAELERAIIEGCAP